MQLPPSEDRPQRRETTKMLDPFARGRLPLWSSAVITGGIAAALLFIYLLGRFIFGPSIPDRWWEPGLPISGDPGTNWLDIVKVALTIVAGAGGAVALVVAFRKQWVSETVTVPHQLASELRSQAAEAREIDRSYRDRYATAAGQLGDHNPTVRLAGVYALANLADTWTEQRQQCVDVLCAHLRLPWNPAPDDPLAHTTIERPLRGHGKRILTYPSDRGEREVRQTILRVIGAHLQPDDKRPLHHSSWSDLSIDLTGAQLPDIDWRHADIPAGIGFNGASFSGAVSFDGASFSGDAWFDGASFSGQVWFMASFSGTAWFEGASFSGPAWFLGALFTGPARFERASFSGDAKFERASFTGDAIFGGASFTGNAWFNRATFSGSAVFGETTFLRTAQFTEAEFMGYAEFTGASFARGVPPQILDFLAVDPPKPWD